MTNHDVEHSIRKRMSGDVRDAFVAIGQCRAPGSSPFACVLPALGQGGSQHGVGLGHLQGILWGYACTQFLSPLCCSAEREEQASLLC